MAFSWSVISDIGYVSDRLTTLLSSEVDSDIVIPQSHVQESMESGRTYHFTVQATNYYGHSQNRTIDVTH